MLNSPNLTPYFSLNKFARNCLLIFSSLLYLISSRFLITQMLHLYVLFKKKLGVDLSLINHIHSSPCDKTDVQRFQWVYFVSLNDFNKDENAFFCFSKSKWDFVHLTNDKMPKKKKEIKFSWGYFSVNLKWETENNNNINSIL